jgi:hypothetical protein
MRTSTNTQPEAFCKPGIALAAAELYARYKIPSIPLGEDKRPLVGRFKIAGLSMAQSRAFMQRRPEATALGIPDGRLSGIVRLDIDEHGDDIERAVIERAGDTPFKVRTASNKRHLIYAYNGERRLTGSPGHSNARPWPDLKIDLCGDGGFSVSPPSRCNGGEYELLGDVTLEQLLENRHSLPTVRGLPERAYVPSSAARTVPVNDIAHQPLAEMREGSGRNATLFHALCKVARHLPPSLDAFADWAREHNGKFGVPMTDAEVFDTAKSVFGYVERGELRTGEHGAWFVYRQAQELARDPYLFALIAWLKAENGPESEFWVADGLCSPKYLHWPIGRLRYARDKAMETEWIKRIVEPAKGRNAVYVWGPKARGHLWPDQAL